MALGAGRRETLALIVGQGMRLVAAGVVIGLGASFAMTRLLARLLFGVAPTDALTFVVVPALLSLVAFLAMYVPARRAKSVPGYPVPNFRLPGGQVNLAPILAVGDRVAWHRILLGAG